MRTLPLLTAALLATLLASPAPAAQAESAQRPRSVLFYLIDTCRGDRTGPGGYRRGTTRFLDELAQRAVVFERCSSQASWTKPSMASLLTSQYPSTTGVYRMEQRLPEALLTWPEVLRGNGYHTAGFSANVVMGNALSNLAQGFEHFVESTAINRGDPIRFASGSARKLNEHVLPWLERTDHWPMLLYVHSVDPHEEYEPEGAYLERFADPERHPRFREEWRKLLESRPPIPGLHVRQANFDATGIDSASFVGHASNLYDADVAANDDQLAVLWDALQAHGWGDDLILVVTADHGEEFFDHGATSHGYSLYEEMTHVPLLICAPGLLPAGKRVAAPVRSLDLFPTLCELLGIAPPPGLAGESLVSLARGAEAAERPVFSEHREDPLLRRIGQSPGTMTSLRRGRWKLILNEVASQLCPKPRVELFDLEADPRELVNVADQHPEHVARLLAEVEAFIARRKESPYHAESDTLDEAALAELRALGYLGEDEDAAPAPPSLWDALATKDLALVRRSLEAGADPNALEPATGVSPLALAALAGERELAALLLESGAAVDGRSSDGSTALGAAAFFGRVDVLEFLLEKGADRAARSTQGDTALEATRAPWNVTKFVADLLGIEIDRAELEAGREECARILTGG
jgi:arylsulfatase A-like enzyme